MYLENTDEWRIPAVEHKENEVKRKVKHQQINNYNFTVIKPVTLTKKTFNFIKALLQWERGLKNTYLTPGSSSTEATRCKVSAPCCNF